MESRLLPDGARAGEERHTSQLEDEQPAKTVEEEQKLQRKEMLQVNGGAILCLQGCKFLQSACFKIRAEVHLAEQWGRIQEPN